MRLAALETSSLEAITGERCAMPSAKESATGASSFGICRARGVIKVYEKRKELGVAPVLRRGGHLPPRVRELYGRTCYSTFEDEERRWRREEEVIILGSGPTA